MSMMPAFSPGPCSTSLLRVGSFLRCKRELLYEQCSLHITLKMPSSVYVGSRHSSDTILSYSEAVRLVAQASACSNAEIDFILNYTQAEACATTDCKTT